MSYLKAVRKDAGAGSAGSANEEKGTAMSHLMNRMLDMVVTYAVLGLTLTVAGATVVLGA
jgi:hypothetical protein